jgi:hypothetical protein
MPAKKKSTASTAATTTALSSAPANTLTAGDMVHYHAQGDIALDATSALPALALNARDLLVFKTDGTTEVARDAQHSPTRKTNHWSHKGA